jgi:hypothetical protein
VAIMEVPCCSGLLKLVMERMFHIGIQANLSKSLSERQ